MNCCCLPEDNRPQNNSSLDKFNQTLLTSTTHHKPKFSFRSSQASSQAPSEVSRSSVFQHDNELQQLEREYQMLLAEQRATEDFERSRVSALQREVAFYEREIMERERQISQLSTLYQMKMQERSTMAQHPVVVIKRDPQEEFSNSTQP